MACGSQGQARVHRWRRRQRDHRTQHKASCTGWITTPESKQMISFLLSGIWPDDEVGGMLGVTAP